MGDHWGGAGGCAVAVGGWGGWAGIRLGERGGSAKHCLAVYARPLAQPDIRLLGDGSIIQNAEMAPSMKAGTDFGPAALSSTIERTFEVANVGPAALTLTGPESSLLSIAGSGAFTVSSQPSASVIAGNGGQAAFTIRFSPTTVGIQAAMVTIPNEDPDESPFTFKVQGVGGSAQEQYDHTAAAAGLVGAGSAFDAVPFSDGVPNLIKYAFNMHLDGADVTMQTPGGAPVGLPAIAYATGGSSGVLRIEFARRVGSGLVYQPEKTVGLAAGSWQAIASAPDVTSINTMWERVVYEEPLAAGERRVFGRVRVLFP